MSIHFPARYITWSDLHTIYDKDERLASNLKKAHKLTYTALHPGNNKQNVPLALAIFDESTIAATKSYLPERHDIAGFLTLIQKWWTVANSKQRFSPNVLGNAIIRGDGKTNFFMSLADWVENWKQSPAFRLTPQTASALIVTLRAQALLIDELLEEGYLFVLTGRLQSDPIERRFSQYRQMSGGRFLVSLREVLNSERILACRSLIKEHINFWEEDLNKDLDANYLEKLKEAVEPYSTEIFESVLDPDAEEVATTIAGYIAKKLTKRSNCELCKPLMVAHENDLAQNHYLNLLSRGGLTVPSSFLADFTCYCFAVFDYTDRFIQTHSPVNVRKAANYILNLFSPKIRFACDTHSDWGFRFSPKIIINIFYNNKQKVAADTVAVVHFKKRQRK